LRKLGFDKALLGIQVVVAGFIDHSNSSVPSSLSVRESDVDFSALE
jgi:hypothetical protein